jgi:hypothetical protein
MITRSLLRLPRTLAFTITGALACSGQVDPRTTEGPADAAMDGSSADDAATDGLASAEAGDSRVPTDPRADAADGDGAPDAGADGIEPMG